MKRTDFENRKLVKFSIRVSGNMRESVSTLVISSCENDPEKARMVISEKKSRNLNKAESVYLVDKAIFSDIKEIFMKYEMYNWNARQLSCSHVKDEKSCRYSFVFDDEEFNFSVQTFMKGKSDGIRELESVTEKYRLNGAC